MGSLEPVTGDVEAAIARVLEAESAAGAAVATCTAEATTILEQARANALRIAERAGERLHRLTARIDAAAAREVEALDGAVPTARDRSLEDPRQLTRIVAAIAAELTGAP